MHFLFPPTPPEWTDSHVNSLEQRGVEGWRREEDRGGVKREGQERLLKGVPPFVLFAEAFLFSFLLPFERRVKTK